MSNYKPTIGLEVHVELKSKNKVFSNVLNKYDALPNTLVDVIDLGYPGVLPTINSEVIDIALRAVLAMNMKVSKKMHFDRKNYYYPDLTKGYQITQDVSPIGYDGYLVINDKKIGIERLHIEEDTAKSLHSSGVTLLNYNRSGVPLVEIVTRPDISSSLEAMKFLTTLKELLFYLGVSDCKMEEGSMRCDVNISLSDSDVLGKKVEIKNIGSFKEVGLTIEYEIKRQSELLDNNEDIEIETRRFDGKTNTTVVMRKKEILNDYKYLAEPDIPFIYITDEKIEEIKKELVLLPDDRRNIYLDRDILDINIEKIINNKELSDYLNLFIDTDINFKIASNLLLGEISSYINNKRISILDTKLTYDKFIELVTLLDSGKITNQIFKSIIDDIMEIDLDIKAILLKNNISLISNDVNLDELVVIINKILENEKESVSLYKSGKDNAFKYLMGLVMKEVKGRFNPKVVNDTLSSLLK